MGVKFSDINVLEIVNFKDIKILRMHFNPLASPCAGAPALKYGDVNSKYNDSLPWRGQQLMKYQI